MAGLLVLARQGGRAITGSGEQDGGFACDDIEVLRFTRAGVASASQLQYFALGNGVGGLRHVGEDIHVTQPHH